MNQSLKSERMSRILFIMCWLVYTCSYIGRLNYSAALAGMVDSGVWGKPQAGLIGTVFFFCYGGGQLLSGYFGDRISPFKMIGIGVFTACLANSMMFASKSYAAMLIFWGINGLANSMLWSPILHIISHTLEKNQRKRACLSIASAVPCGTILAYLLSMAVMSRFAYTAVFLMAAVCLFLVFCLWVPVSLKTKRVLAQEGQEAEEEETKEVPTERKEPAKKLGFWSLLLSSGIVFAVLPIVFQGMLNTGIVTWVPAMITEIYEVTPVFSLLLSMFLPLINLSGAYISTFIDDRLVHNEAKTALCLFVFALLPVSVLIGIDKLPAVVCVVLLAMVTTSMTGINHMIITMMPFRLSKFGRASTLTGFLNSMAYAGTALSNYGFGALAENLGWHVTILFWVGLVFCSVVFCVFAAIKWGPFLRRIEQEN